MDNLQYPIGKVADQKFTGKEAFDQRLLKMGLADIRFLPLAMENSILNLDEAQLQVPYRDGGWTIQQVVHHVADSHMNAYIRFKLGLTENEPTIKTYEEKEWAKLPDTANVPINYSITLLHALHERFTSLLGSLSEEQWQRTVFHPVQNRPVSLWELFAMYAWHGRHHTAHITSLRQRMGWN